MVKRVWLSILGLLMFVMVIAAGCGGGSSDSAGASGTGGTNNNPNPTTFNRAVSAANPIVGDWGAGVTSTSKFSLTFYPNGKYMMWDNGAAGGTGVEYGTYTSTVSGSTVTVTVTSTLDDQGDNPANPIGASGLTEQSGQTKTISFTIVDQNTIQGVQGDGTPFTLHRAVDANNPIVGSWGSGEEPDNPTLHIPLMVVFYPNGTYIHYEAQTNATCQATGSVSCQPGAEYGTYSYNAATSTLTASATVDNNGDVGLANGNGTGRTMHVTVNSDVISFTD